MGLSEILGIRQYTTFDRAGKVVKMYEVRFTTERGDGEYSFDMPVDEYTPETMRMKAKDLAEKIDVGIGKV